MTDIKLERITVVARSRLGTYSCLATRYVLFLFLSLLFGISIAISKERACDGVIYATPGEIVHANGEVSFGRGHHDPYSGRFHFEHESMVLITGKGSCRLGQENKKCRKNAANAAHNCASAIWGERWDKTIPSGQCGSGTNATIKEWAPDAPGIARASLLGDIKKTIEYQACCHIVPSAKSVGMVVGYISDSSQSGGFTRREERRTDRAQKACARKELFTSNYQVDCFKLRAEGSIQCPQVPDSKPIKEYAKASKTTSTTSASQADIERALERKQRDKNPAKRSNPFQIKSAEISLIKFPKASDKQQCPRKVLIRTTFATNKAGQVEFKLHRSHKRGKPADYRATAQKINGKWKAIHERVITVKKSINRSFMAETTNEGIKVRATPWEKLVIRCDQGHSASDELRPAD